MTGSDGDRVGIAPGTVGRPGRAARPASRAHRRVRLASGALAALLAVATVVLIDVTVSAASALSDAYTAVPPLATRSWVRRIDAATALQSAAGSAAVATAVAALLCAVVAVAGIALGSPARRAPSRLARRLVVGFLGAVGALAVIASALILTVPGVSAGGVPAADSGGQSFSAAVASAQQRSEGAEAVADRGALPVGTAVGWAGVVLLAAAGGCAARRRPRGPVVLGVIALALAAAAVRAAVTAADPIRAVLVAPSYPAVSAVADPTLSALAPVLVLGASCAAVAAAAVGALRALDAQHPPDDTQPPPDDAPPPPRLAPRTPRDSAFAPRQAE